MTHNASRFPGSVALVTGGTSGIGFAIARRLLDEGARVVITGRDEHRLAAAAAELGERALPVRADVAELGDLNALTERIQARFGRLDVLVANAGIAAFRPVTEVTPTEFDTFVATNLRGVYFTVQQTIPLLAAGGAVVVNASWTRLRGLAGGSLYSATKAAAHNLVQTLGAELAPRGIRVNAVSPGYIATPMYHANVTPAAAAVVAAEVPLGRPGTADEVAAAVAFLASSDAAYITGQDLVIDGGLVAAAPRALG
ncbi:SDR family NAD(P)-dependent oxidoreductase [Nocardia sp. NPDC057227]|uniref:SDR family NAD(P)-dependent oxidoreductase n=1 Tax=Nocardia sp. NPDC057227 TaxID=3346056 RepID=UPI003638BB0C